MARGAYPYVAMRPPGPIPASTTVGVTGAPERMETRTPLPIDSPTLLTRRRYDLIGSLRGFLRTGTLADRPTGRIPIHPWPGNGKVTPQWPHLTGSDVGAFVGAPVGMGMEQDPDRVKMPIGLGWNFLVTIAHRSTYPAPRPAIHAGLYLSDRSMKARPRRYALPFQIPNPQSYQNWPTSSQWIASMMPGTGGA